MSFVETPPSVSIPKDKGVTSLSLIRKEVIDINQVKLRLVENFKLVFKAEINFDSN